VKKNTEKKEKEDKLKLVEKKNKELIEKRKKMMFELKKLINSLSLPKRSNLLFR